MSTFEERHGRPRCRECPPVDEDFLLLENGEYLLQEDTSKIELE